MFQWILDLKNSWYYFFLVVGSAIFVYFSNFFLTEVLVYNVLGEQYTASQIQKILSDMTRWQLFAYLFIPLSVYNIVFIKGNLSTFPNNEIK